jgi:hypothetical protein
MGGLLWGAEIENSDERNGLTVEIFYSGVLRASAAEYPTKMIGPVIRPHR